MTAGIVLFSGPGGTCEGLRQAGVAPMIGVEFETDAVRTARAAGHTAILGDVAALDPATVRSELGEGGDLLLQSSPPCQGLSMAGGHTGRADMVHLLTAIAQLRAGVAQRSDIPRLCRWLRQSCSDDRSSLTFETVRWLSDLDPTYVFLEQVPAALPIWEAIAGLLRTWGYSTWTGNVQSEQFGVPQTRKRAVLLASLRGPVSAPVPTHSKFHQRATEVLDYGVLPWISMASALGWGTSRAQVWAEVEPRVNNQSGTYFDLAWPLDRPAPTVAGREIVTMPGANANRFNGATKSRNDGVRLTATEAGVLQGFEVTYPWQGGKSSQHVQIGNAVPPPLSRALTEHLLATDSTDIDAEFAALLIEEGHVLCRRCEREWDHHNFEETQWVKCP